ncbi:hypothetical protein KCU97_g12850, partial [Aureobasidium melanogenum]
MAYSVNHHGNGDKVAMADCHDDLTVEMLLDVIKELDAARKNKISYNSYPKRDKCFFRVHGKDDLVDKQSRADDLPF